MKYIFISTLLLLLGFAKGQIVNIPDSNFKYALIGSGVDINNDMEIQTSEAVAVVDLNINQFASLPYYVDRSITDFTGIKAFTNMKNFRLSLYADADSLDVSDLSQLETLDGSFGFSILNKLILTGCTGLKDLNMRSNSFRTLDVSTCINLEYLNVSACTDLVSLTIGNLPRLKAVNLLDAGRLTTRIDFTGCDSLVNLNLTGVFHLQSVNISGLTQIEELIHFGLIDSLIARNCTSLKRIESEMFAGVHEFLDVSGCTSLENIDIKEAFFLHPLELNTCPSIQTVNLNFVRTSYINLKNGTTASLSLRLLDNGSGQIPHINICADDFETTDIAWLNIEGGTYTVNSFCSFTPGGSYNTINGKVRLSIDANDCDSTDRIMPYIPVKLTDNAGNNIIRNTNVTGNYGHYLYTGQALLTPYFPYSYFTINPSTASVTFDTINSLIAVRNFCIQPTGVYNDVEISFLPVWPVARPGFNAAYTLIFKNRGTTTLSGNVTVNFDNNKMNFVAASENVTTQSSGQLLWNYSNLQPFESRTINVTFNLLPPPVNNIGDTISYLAVITPSDNDETAFDNIFILPQTVIGSFDPNDKQCIEGSKLDISKIGDYLHYQVRFQNEGTDTAFNIVVADTLSDNLDWNTFEYIGSSHTADVKLSNNKLEFFFANINLPYKAIDEPGSNGWVAFKIKPKPSVVIGDSLNNRAAIYFDYNLPVITNTATTIVSSAATPVPVKLEYFSVNKKGNANQLNWKASCTYGNAAFVIERSDDGIHFKAIGNITATALRCQLPFNFIDNNPVAGKNYYRLKISDADGKSFNSKTLVIGNNKAGVEITAIANNTVYFTSNKQQVITMKIVVADGREILNQKQTVAAGNNNIHLQIKSMGKGIYTLLIYTNNQQITIKKFIR
jgi:uncharacterized repeat protein (TIGR01451 family)